MSVKLIIIAGPPSAGKTAVIRQIIKNLLPKKVAYLKIDVVQASEDEELAKEFDIPTKKVYSEDMCPDHMGIMVIRDAVLWAEKESAEYLLYESAGLCLRCTPYTKEALGICVISSLSGMHAPLKMVPMISLSDVAVVTKIDLISPAEKEVFREKIKEVAPAIDIVETNAIYGTGMSYLMKKIERMDVLCTVDDELRGVPPLGVCTICIGKKQVGWQEHFGVVRPLNSPDCFYRGE